MNRALLLTIFISLLQSSCWKFSNNSDETVAHNPDNSGFKSGHSALLNPEPNCDTFSEGRETKVSCSIYKDKSETEKDQLRVALNELRDSHDIDWTYQLVSGPQPEDIVCDSPKEETFHCTITNPPHVKSTFRFKVSLKATSKESRDHRKEDSVNLPFGARNWGKVPIAGAYFNNLVTLEQKKVGYQTTPFVANEMTFGNIHAMCFRNGVLHFASDDFVYQLEYRKDKSGALKPFAKHFAGAPYTATGMQTRKTVRLQNRSHILHCGQDALAVKAAPGKNVAASTQEFLNLPIDDTLEPTKFTFPSFNAEDMLDMEISETHVYVLMHEGSSVIYRKAHGAFKAIRYTVATNLQLLRILLHPKTGELYGVTTGTMGNLYKIVLEVPPEGEEVGRAVLHPLNGSYGARTFAFDPAGQLYFLDRTNSLFRMDGNQNDGFQPVDMGIQYLSTDPAAEMAFGPGTFPENLFVRLKGKPGTIFENQTLDRIVAKRGGGIELIAGIRTLIQNPSENPITPKQDFQIFAVKFLALSQDGNLVFNDDPNRSRISFLDPKEGPTKGHRVTAGRKSQEVPSLIRDITDINVGTIKGMAMADRKLYFTAVASNMVTNLFRVDNPHSLDRMDRIVTKIDLPGHHPFPTFLTAGGGRIFYLDSSGVWSFPSDESAPATLLTTQIPVGVVELAYAKDTLIMTSINRQATKNHSMLTFFRKQPDGSWSRARHCKRIGFELNHARIDSQGTLYYVQGPPMGAIEATSNPPDHRISMIRNFDENVHCDADGNEDILEEGQIWLDYAKERIKEKPGLACRAGSIKSPIVDSSVAKTYLANADEICPTQITAFALRDNCTEPYAEDPNAPKGVSIFTGGTVGESSRTFMPTELGQVVQFITPCPGGDI